MTTTRSASLLRRLLLLLAVFALVATACSSDDDDGDDASPSEEPSDTGDDGDDEEAVPVDAPGVTDDSISVAAFGTNSNNPLGTCVLDCFIDGIEAYFAYVNSEGGVYGRELEISVTLDDELGKNKERALEIVSAQDDVFAAFSATQIASGWGDIASAGIPLFVWNIHPAETKGQEGIFGNAASICIECTRRHTAYAVQQAGATKVATLGYGVSQNSKLSAQAAADSVEKYSDELDGAEVVYTNVDLAFGLPNGVGPEVSAMKDAGVDFVLASIDLNGMKTLSQEMARQGMGDVPLYHANTYDEAFVKDAGDLFVGDYFGVGFQPFEGESESQALFQKWMQETGSEVKEISVVGWINAHLLHQGLLEAGPEFSREKVIAAINDIEDYTADGLTPPVDWGRQHEPPTEDDAKTNGNDPDCFALLTWSGEAYEFVEPSSPEEPFICWPAETRDWSEPEARSFE